ncbi:universal stress protein [Nocardioides mangrovi]|uniref:Universal stress protein n=1 Tax=Nocardioides mangrovi TaxID=2874580 RepID=A0ABS7U7N4_9ACTN|nr:universal stress protein [Nocardioides mangrovi]MBZ5736951.1 universal stress protein [Nocardioides mangrovi]
MSESSFAPVDVVVPHDGIDSALHFAAREALLTGRPLRVVGPADLAHGGLVDRSAGVAELLAGPGVPVDTLVTPTADLGAMLATCADAALVVVHRTSMLHLMQALSAGEVDDRGFPTVACVPPTWAPRPDEAGPVVVAVDHAFDAAAELLIGLEQARIHEAPLHLVHAWDLRGPLGPVEDRTLGRLWTAQLAARLREQLEALAPGLPVVVDVQRGPATDVVLRAARGGQLLVLGRNPPSPDGRCHLGRTARTAIHESHCPVLLTPPLKGDTEVPTARGRTALPGPRVRRNPADATPDR